MAPLDVAKSLLAPATGMVEVAANSFVPFASASDMLPATCFPPPMVPGCATNSTCNVLAAF